MVTVSLHLKIQKGATLTCPFTIQATEVKHTKKKKLENLLQQHPSLLSFNLPFQKALPMSLSSTAPFITIYLFLFLLQNAYAALPIIPLNTTCQNTCGTMPVKYPFGTGFGCGHPAFSSYIRCNHGTLQFTTGTGTYIISSIDYPSSTIIISDPFMSNCSIMQNSGSFILDGTSPFKLGKDNIFVLLGCSTTSPLFDPSEDFCDTGSGTRVCRGLYSCKGVAGIGLPQNGPISTCCVYDYESPAELGLGYSLDLPKMQCSSYASIYEFGGDEGDPMKWKFGVTLAYNDSYYSDSCRNCEDSGGLCGFGGLDESFACICRNGVNTTTNCFGRGYAWSGTMGLKIQSLLTIGGLLLSWMLSPI